MRAAGIISVCSLRALLVFRQAHLPAQRSWREICGNKTMPDMHIIIYTRINSLVFITIMEGANR
jgi:hypothetical protein